MATKRRRELTKERILKALESGATSLSELNRKMGGSGNIPWSTSRRIKELVPDIQTRLEANRALGKKPQAVTAKSRRPDRPSGKSRPSGQWTRHAKNPFREGSSYATAYDIVAAHPRGLRKDEWVELFCKATGKDLKHARYDLAVLLSAKESATSQRHRSCRDGFWMERDNDHVRLRTQ